jgi:capsular exopolysaccharide synthesis family protein
VIVACCDLRRPRLHEFFGLDNTVGFTSVLLGDIPLSAALQDVAGRPGLRVLASGPLPPNPAELLASRRATEVLTALRAQAHMVLVDSPPVLPVTDAAVLSSRVDATLVVATAGLTTKRELVRTLEVLGQVDAPVAGVVLNGVGGEGSYGYRYGYGYRYYRYERPAEEKGASGNGAPRRKSRLAHGVSRDPTNRS